MPHRFIIKFVLTITSTLAATTEDSNTTLCFVVFDIVHLNGRDLLELPLSSRLQVLSEHISETKHAFEMATRFPVKTAADVLSKLDVCIKNK